MRHDLRWRYARTGLVVSCVAAAAVFTGGCQQSAPSPPPPASSAPRPSVVVPLGPAAPVDIPSDVDAEVLPRVDAWGQTVAVAWWERASGLRIAISGDAGRTFEVRTPPVHGEDPRDRTIALAVREPSDTSRPSRDGEPESRVEIWCRVGSGNGASAIRSTTGGRTFDASIPADTRWTEIFPEPWELTSASSVRTLSLLPPPLLRYVGVQQTPRPEAALDEGLPPMTLDEHGALAVVWRERTATGEARVLRRYAIDWNAKDPRTPPFDAAVPLIPDAAAAAPALARVPGGIMAVWIANGHLRTRRVGLDMTCNPNRVR